MHLHLRFPKSVVQYILDIKELRTFTNSYNNVLMVFDRCLMCLYFNYIPTLFDVRFNVTLLLKLHIHLFRAMLLLRFCCTCVFQHLNVCVMYMTNYCKNLLVFNLIQNAVLTTYKLIIRYCHTLMHVTLNQYFIQYFV